MKRNKNKIWKTLNSIWWFIICVLIGFAIGRTINNYNTYLTARAANERTAAIVNVGEAYMIHKELGNKAVVNFNAMIKK